MKRINKIIPYSFFGIVFLTFFFSLVFNIAIFSGIIELFSQFKESWSVVIGYFLELLLAIAMMVFTILLILKIRKSREDNSLYFFKANSFLMMVYGSVSALYWLLNAIALGDSGAASLFIAMMLLLISAIVFFALATFVNNSRRLFAAIGYFSLFAYLVVQASIAAVNPVIILKFMGIQGFQVAINFFSFLMVIVGAIHIVVYDFDLVTLRQYLNSKAQDLINEEVPVNEEPEEDDDEDEDEDEEEKEESEEEKEEEEHEEEPNKEE